MGSIPVRSTKKHRMQFCIRCFLVLFLVNRPRFVNMACHILAEGLPLAGNGKFPSKKRFVVIISRYCSTRKLPFLAFCGYEYKCFGASRAGQLTARRKSMKNFTKKVRCKIIIALFSLLTVVFLFSVTFTMSKYVIEKQVGTLTF